jgi:excinuclease ABC subunit B
VVEQIIRPTGLVDPEVVVKPTKGQIDDLLARDPARADRTSACSSPRSPRRWPRTSPTTCSSWGSGAVPALRGRHPAAGGAAPELRLGEYDVLVGINLLREGLDLPEVSLVAILDADKEGFLRSATSLIQTIGRAARNVSGEVHMYADRITASMEQAIEETNRRREIQVATTWPTASTPPRCGKRIADITDLIAREDEDTRSLLGGSGRRQSRGKAQNGAVSPLPVGRHEGMPQAELADSSSS